MNILNTQPMTRETAQTAATQQHWRIELFGALRAVRGVGSVDGDVSGGAPQVLTRFQTVKTAALLAYLALKIPKGVPRETLADLIWPDADPSAARNSLRVALNSLRRQLEPPGLPPGAILSADRTVVTLSRRMCQTDVAEFEELVRREKATGDDAQKTVLLRQIVALYKGDLLDGWSETWLLAERARFAESCMAALKQLVRVAAQTGDYESSLGHARRALELDPLREGAHRDLMRLYLALKRPEAALRQYDEMERRLEEDMGTQPSQVSRDLAAQILRAGTDAASDALPLEWEGGNSSVAVAEAAMPLPSGAAERTSGDKTTSAEPDGAVGNTASDVEVRRVVGAFPLTFTRFFGRETELARLADMVTPSSSFTGNRASLRPRCISVSGPAGIGKTRLVLETCHRLREAYADRIWFVPLSDLEQPERLALFVANALSVPSVVSSSRTVVGDDGAGDIGLFPIVDQIGMYLAGEPALLVLDNVEHLLQEDADDLTNRNEETTLSPAALMGDDGVARLLQMLLVRLPNLVVLLTTRRRLEMDGEQEMTVTPLPAPDQSLTPADLMRFASIQLFLDRAQSVRPDFQITAGNAPAVAALCERLEGIPLAIELAAAWATALTPAQMLERLSRRFDLLVSRRRDRGARHLTLRAALDYSYELLPSTLKRFFRQITVFRGGMSLEAAEEISQSPDALEMLTQLEQRSLLLSEEAGAAMRFRLLETLREYGWERLTSDEQAQLEWAHTDVFVRFADSAKNQLVGPDSALWLRSLDMERENLRIALERLLARGDATHGSENDAEDALRLSGILWRFWYSRGYVAEGLRTLESALQSDSEYVSSDSRATALEGAGRLAAALGDYARAGVYLGERLTLVRALGSDIAIETTLFNLCLVSNDAGNRERAREHFEELLTRQRRIGETGQNRWRLSGLLHDLAQVTDDNDAAVLLIEEGLALCGFDALNARWHFATLLDALSDVKKRIVAALAPDAENRTSLDERAEFLRSQADDLRVMHWNAATGASYLNLGDLSLNQGDYPIACEMLSEALTCFRADRDAPYEAIALEHLCVTSLRQNDGAAAARYALQALRIRRAQNDHEGIAYCERLLSTPTTAASSSAPFSHS